MSDKCRSNTCSVHRTCHSDSPNVVGIRARKQIRLTNRTRSNIIPHLPEHWSCCSCSSKNVGSEMDKNKKIKIISYFQQFPRLKINAFEIGSRKTPLESYPLIIFLIIIYGCMMTALITAARFNANQTVLSIPLIRSLLNLLKKCSNPNILCET